MNSVQMTPQEIREKAEKVRTLCQKTLPALCSYPDPFAESSEDKVCLSCHEFYKTGYPNKNTAYCSEKCVNFTLAVRGLRIEG